MIVVVVVVVAVLKSAASAFVLPNAAPFYVFPPLSLHLHLSLSLSLSLSILSCLSDVCKIETGRQTERQEGRERER